MLSHIRGIFFSSVSFQQFELGLEADNEALGLGLRPQGWDLGLKDGIWASWLDLSGGGCRRRRWPLPKSYSSFWAGAVSQRLRKYRTDGQTNQHSWYSVAGSLSIIDVGI